MTEQEVHIKIAEVLSGNTSSFATLVDSYKNLVHSVALKITANQELAEEVAQDTFVKAYQGLAKFKQESKFSTWIYQITYFTAINALRKNKVETTEISDFNTASADDGGIDHLEKEDRNALIEKALTYLPAQDRAVVVLFYLKEMSMEEVAEITKLSVSNAKVKVHRSRKKLHDILSGLLKSELNTIRYED